MTDPRIRPDRTRHGPRTIALLGGALVLLGLLGFAAPLLTDLLGAVWQRDLEAQLERMAGLQRWRGMEAGVGGRTVTATVTAELRPTQARRTHPRGRDLGSGAALCR
ncbi:MAG: hypothetical protein GF320_10740, partial [Armatimonadia bacterium]|nr:hypothetical protein [Armatimonadia bacterium]